MDYHPSWSNPESEPNRGPEDRADNVGVDRRGGGEAHAARRPSCDHDGGAGDDGPDDDLQHVDAVVDVVLNLWRMSGVSVGGGGGRGGVYNRYDTILAPIQLVVTSSSASSSYYDDYFHYAASYYPSSDVAPSFSSWRAFCRAARCCSPTGL